MKGAKKHPCILDAYAQKSPLPPLLVVELTVDVVMLVVVVVEVLAVAGTGAGRCWC